MDQPLTPAGTATRPRPSAPHRRASQFKRTHFVDSEGRREWKEQARGPPLPDPALVALTALRSAAAWR